MELREIDHISGNTAESTLRPEAGGGAAGPCVLLKALGPGTVSGVSEKAFWGGGVGARLPGATAQPPRVQTWGGSAPNPASTRRATGKPAGVRGHPASVPGSAALKPRSSGLLGLASLRLLVWGFLAGTLWLWVCSIGRSTSLALPAPLPLCSREAPGAGGLVSLCKALCSHWDRLPSQYRRHMAASRGRRSCRGSWGTYQLVLGEGGLLRSPKLRLSLGSKTALLLPSRGTPGLWLLGCERGTVALPPRGLRSVWRSHREPPRRAGQELRQCEPGGARQTWPAENGPRLQRGGPLGEAEVGAERSGAGRCQPVGRDTHLGGLDWGGGSGLEQPNTRGRGVGVGAPPGADWAQASSQTRLHREPRWTSTPAGHRGPAGV